MLYKIKKTDGSVSIYRLIKGTIEEAIEKLSQSFSVPIESWSEVEEDEIPKSRNYRNAWIDNGQIDIDLEKAKLLQKNLMINKAKERDEFGVLSENVKDEIRSIDTSQANNLTELYNMWPPSIEMRSGPREYMVR